MRKNEAIYKLYSAVCYNLWEEIGFVSVCKLLYRGNQLKLAVCIRLPFHYHRVSFDDCIEGSAVNSVTLRLSWMSVCSFFICRHEPEMRI